MVLLSTRFLGISLALPLLKPKLQLHNLFFQTKLLKLLHLKVFRPKQFLIPNRSVRLRNQCANVVVNISRRYHCKFTLRVSKQQVQLLQRFVEAGIVLRDCFGTAEQLQLLTQVLGLFT